MHRVHAPQQPQPPRRLQLRRQHQDRHRRALARDAPSGRSRHGETGDRRRVHRRRDRLGRLGERVGGGRIGPGHGEMHAVAMRRIAFHRIGDRIHHRHRFDRPVARRAFRRQHDRVGAVIDRGRHVGHFGARRRRRGDHRFEHLRRDDHRAAHPPRGLDDALLQRRHRLRRQLDAQVAARHHHAVALLDDLLEPRHRARLLDLREQRRAPLDQPPCLGKVLGPLDEAQRDPVDALLHGKGQVAAVLLGQRRHRQHHVGHVQPLVVRKRAADLDQRGDPVGRMRLHAQHQLAVVEQQPRAVLDRLENLAVGQLHASRIARRLVAIQRELVPRRQRHATVRELADAQLRPLQVGEDRGGPAQPLLERTDRGDHRNLRFRVAVAHVDAKGGGAGFEQPLDHFGAVARRAQRGEHADLARTGIEGLGHGEGVHSLVRARL